MPLICPLYKNALPVMPPVDWEVRVALGRGDPEAAVRAVCRAKGTAEPLARQYVTCPHAALQEAAATAPPQPSPAVPAPHAKPDPPAKPITALVRSTAPLPTAEVAGTAVHDRDHDLGQRALDRGWVSREMLEEALRRREADPGLSMVSLLSISEQQLLELHTPSLPPPEEAAAAMKDPRRRAGRYWIVDLVNQGAMGTIYRAWQEHPGRWVALKFSKTPEGPARTTFLREAQLASALDHPNIAKIYDVGVHETVPFIAMQFIDGQNLSQLRDGFKVTEAIRVMRDVALAVDYAHRQGVIHRDLKPANIMLDRDRNAYVTDFCIARRLDADGDSGRKAVVGTAEYMPPEQASGDVGAVDHFSDVYSLGATLYHLLTGHPPFFSRLPEPRAAREAVLDAVVNQYPINLGDAKPDIPFAIQQSVMKCLEKQKARRQASARELADELDRFLNRPPRSVAVTAIGLLNTVAACFYAVGAVAAAMMTFNRPRLREHSTAGEIELALLGLFAILGLLLFAAGYGVLRRRRWGRRVAIGISVLFLVGALAISLEQPLVALLMVVYSLANIMVLTTAAAREEFGMRPGVVATRAGPR